MRYLTIFKLGFIVNYGVANYLLCKCCYDKVEEDTRPMRATVKQTIKNICEPEPIATPLKMQPHAINKMQPASGIIYKKSPNQLFFKSSAQLIAVHF